MYVYDETRLNQAVFNFIYGCALRDAILQKSFVGEKAWIAKVTEAEMLVKEYIDAVLRGDFEGTSRERSGKSLDKHNEVFLDTAIKVCDVINNYVSKPELTDKFTFGNAQKLINMVVKHVSAHSHCLNSLGHGSIREKFIFCHCPMDTIMLTQVWKEYANAFGKEKRKQQLANDFCKAWGSEDFSLVDGKRGYPQRYLDFQNALLEIVNYNHGSIFPIEYDYLYWKTDK